MDTTDKIFVCVMILLAALGGAFMGGWSHDTKLITIDGKLDYPRTIVTTEGIGYQVPNIDTYLSLHEGRTYVVEIGTNGLCSIFIKQQCSNVDKIVRGIENAPEIERGNKNDC
jgi:hypothetical protein